MKLLIVTQKVDTEDDILGFFHRWIEEFAKHFERVTVIALYEGKHTLPENVSVHSLGKERNVSKLGRVVRFYRYIWCYRNTYDSVFVHMNPEYVVLAGWLWRLMGKKISLWYVHRQKHWKLAVAEKLVQHIFTAASKSFSLDSKKTRIVGHGIDLSLFPCTKKEKGDTLQVLHMGRISKIKDCLTFIRVIKILKDTPNTPVKGILAGGPGTSEDELYTEEVKHLVDELGLQENIVFAGPPKFSDVPRFFFEADVVLNLTPTGGVDKAALSALATCRPLIVSNRAFEEIFGDYSSQLIARHGDAQDFADKLRALLNAPDADEVKRVLRKRIEEGYGLEKLITKLSDYLSTS